MDFSTIAEISSADTCGAGAGADFATAASTMRLSCASSIAGAAGAGSAAHAIATTATSAIISVTDSNLPLLNKCTLLAECICQLRVYYLDDFHSNVIS